MYTRQLGALGELIRDGGATDGTWHDQFGAWHCADEPWDRDSGNPSIYPPDPTFCASPPDAEPAEAAPPARPKPASAPGIPGATVARLPGEVAGVPSGLVVGGVALLVLLLVLRR